MLSVMYPKHSVDVIVNALRYAVDHNVFMVEDDQELIYSAMISLNALSQNDGSVVICKEIDYSRMADNEDLLDSLKGAGVDNWEGYDDALEDYWAQRGDE